jgi:hypothetical protein
MKHSVFLLAARIVGLASRLTPRAVRSEWEREWRAELWHLYRELEARGGPSAWDRAAFVRRSLGSVFDALQLRVGDAQLWRECVSDVAGHWQRHPAAVAAALVLLSLGIAVDAVLVAYGLIMVEAPRSVWGSLGSDTQFLILSVAAMCGVSLIVASGAAAAQLLGSADRSPDRDGVWVVETMLVAGITGWVGRWFAEFVVRTAIPPYPGGSLTSVDVGAAVTTAWVLSWLCGVAILTGLRARRRRAAGRSARLVRLS